MPYNALHWNSYHCLKPIKSFLVYIVGYACMYCTVCAFANLYSTVIIVKSKTRPLNSARVCASARLCVCLYNSWKK